MSDDGTPQPENRDAAITMSEQRSGLPIRSPFPRGKRPAFTRRSPNPRMNPSRAERGQNPTGGFVRPKSPKDPVGNTDNHPFGTPSGGPITGSGGSASVNVRRERRHLAQVAVPLVVVEAVPNDEFIWDVEADVLDGDVDLDRIGFAQQREHLKRFWPA